MAIKGYISKINLGSDLYDLKDATARTDISGIQNRVSTLEVQITGLSGAMHFVGKVVAETVNGDSTQITIPVGPEHTSTDVYLEQKDYSFKPGDTVVYQPEGATSQYEYVFNGSDWSELGSTSELGSLASKDSASGEIDKAPVTGSVAGPSTKVDANKLAIASVNSTTIGDSQNPKTSTHGVTLDQKGGALYSAKYDNSAETLVFTTVTLDDVKTTSATVATGSLTSSGDGASVLTAEQGGYIYESDADPLITATVTASVTVK